MKTDDYFDGMDFSEKGKEVVENSTPIENARPIFRISPFVKLGFNRVLLWDNEWWDCSALSGKDAFILWALLTVRTSHLLNKKMEIHDKYISIFNNIWNHNIKSLQWNGFKIKSISENDLKIAKENSSFQYED